MKDKEGNQINIGDTVFWTQIGSNAEIESVVEKIDGKLIARRKDIVAGIHLTDSLKYIRGRIFKIKKVIV